MTHGDVARDRAMEARIARTLDEAGVDGDGVALVTGAHRLAMAKRIAGGMDAHHPDFLHPGRSTLILLLDTPLRDPVALAAAALVETERPELRVDAATIRGELGGVVADFVGGVPVLEAGIAEALVVAPDDVRLVALAERLDHCRHVKFNQDRAARLRMLRLAETVFGPVAERTDATLARRFAHWVEAFGRTLARGN